MRPSPRRPALPSRRRLLAAAGGSVATAALLTACGDDADGGGGDSSGSGGWTFTDDRGETVTLDRRPETLAGYVGSAAALHDYGIECAAVFGPTVRDDGEPDVQAEGLDVDRLTVLGNTWGEFSVEDYAELEPELLISDLHAPGEQLWYVPEDSADEILALAPGIGILTQSGVLLREAVERYAELAEALGADMTADAVTRARTRFDDAAETLRRAARDNPGLRVLALSATENALYFCVPGDFSDLAYYRDLGVEFTVPDDPDEGGYWQSVSWENADKYHADLIMIDNRSQALRPEDLAQKPTWNRLPAVEAGQTVPWSMEERYTHAGYAPLIEQLANAIRDARRLS